MTILMVHSFISTQTRKVFTGKSLIYVMHVDCTQTTHGGGDQGQGRKNSGVVPVEQ